VRQSYDPRPSAPFATNLRAWPAGWRQFFVRGSIPDQCISVEEVEDDQALDVDRAVARQRIMDDVHRAELGRHSRLLEGLRESQHQYHHIVAAQILSGSCPHLGHILRLVSHRRHKKAPMLMQQMLRLRFGGPTVIPLQDMSCNCKLAWTTGDGGVRARGRVRLIQRWGPHVRRPVGQRAVPWAAVQEAAEARG
jgi:hypothetical protein